MAFKMNNPFKLPGDTKRHNKHMDQIARDAKRNRDISVADAEGYAAASGSFMMKGFPMHETSALKQKTEKIGRYNVDVSTEEGRSIKKAMEEPSTRSTTWDPETGKQVVKEKGKDVATKSAWQKAKGKAKHIVKRAAKYIPVASKVLRKAITRFVPYVGTAATAADIVAINNLMKNQDMGMGEAIKKHYLDIEKKK